MRSRSGQNSPRVFGFVNRKGRPITVLSNPLQGARRWDRIIKGECQARVVVAQQIETTVGASRDIRDARAKVSPYSRRQFDRSAAEQAHRRVPRKWKLSRFCRPSFVLTGQRGVDWGR